jgi:hypothetical protein
LLAAVKQGLILSVRFRRFILNTAAAFSALLATALACGFLGTLSLSINHGCTWKNIVWTQVENGRIDLGWYSPRPPDASFAQTIRFQFHPGFETVDHIYWWGFEDGWYHKRTGSLNYGWRWKARAILPSWCVLLPTAAFPLWWFGRRLRNRPGGFEVITDRG